MRRAIALLPLVLVVVAGCGGDDDSEAVTVTATTETAPALSKAEYIEQADAICKRLDVVSSVLIDEINRNIDLPSTPTQDEALSALEEQSAEVIGEEVRQLGALTPPEGDEATVQRLLNALSELLTVEEANADSASDFRASNTLQDHADDVQSRAHGIGAGYGLKECP